MGRRAMAPTIDGHVRSSRTRSAMFKGVALAVLAVILAGCATGDVGTKTAIGGVGGAALGGLIAAAAGGGGTGIAAGVIGGALIGGLVGNLVDGRDKQMAQQNANKARDGALGHDG